MHSEARAEEISGRQFSKRTIFAAFTQGSLFALYYPAHLADILAMAGYVPKELAEKLKIGGREMYRVPSIIEYVRHVHSEEGSSGLTRGQLSTVACSILYSISEQYTRRALTPQNNQTRTLYLEYKTILKTTMISTAVAVGISHPLEVLGYRQVVQFIGKETIYSSCYSAIKHLFTGPGLRALVDSLLPRYFYYLLPSLFLNLFHKTYEHYLDGRLSWLNPGISNDIIASYFYSAPTITKFAIEFVSACTVLRTLHPLGVVTVTSSISNCGLAAGGPLFATNVGNWMQRFVYMAKNHQLYRNASFRSANFTEHSNAFIVL